MPLLTTAPPPAGDWMPLLLMVVGVVFIGVYLMLSIRAKVARRQAAMVPPRERIERLKSEQLARETYHGAEASYLATTQELAAKLETRAQRLEVLLAQADDVIARLEAANGAARAVPTSIAPPVPEPERATAPELDPLTRSVYDLSDRGLPALEIAQRLDEQIGKVELILALRERAGAERKGD